MTTPIDYDALLVLLDGDANCDATARKAAAAIRALRAAAVEMERDAGRYRYIRDENTNVGNVIDKRDGIHTGVHGEFMGYRYSYRCGADLDERIDEAMAAREPT